MFRKICHRVYGVYHYLKQRIRKLAGKAEPPPADPTEARIQRRLQRSKQRARAAKRKRKT